MAELTAAGPVLVHFFDPTQLNSVRALPYVAEWNSPLLAPRPDNARHPLPAVRPHRRCGGRDRGDRGASVSSMPSRSTSTTRSGTTTGARAGRRCSSGARAARFAGRTTAKASTGRPRKRSRRSSAGERRGRPAAADGAVARDRRAGRAPAGAYRRGSSRAARLREPWSATAGGSPIEIEYEAGEAWVVADGEGEIAAGHRRRAVDELMVPGAGLARSPGHGPHESHHVELEVPEGVRIWAISFAPGLP